MRILKQTLWIAAGLVVSGTLLFGNPVSADIVHPDDVIIQGSLCVGFDCVNGESFGFDTLRLKENNMRVHFLDTSTSASFPPNDWRIVINDSNNGGNSYFRIEDSSAGRAVFEIRAGARSNALTVDSQGDVGIGLQNAAVDLHIRTGNTPTLRLDQDGSSGFTPQAWDVAGNEANFFIRDVTNGSKLPFRIKPNADTNSLYISTVGSVGLGTTSPATNARLHLKETGDAVTMVLENNEGRWQYNVHPTIGRFEIFDFKTNSTPFKIEKGVNSGFFTISNANGGEVIINNSTTVHPDFVFEPDYELESIEEHAAYMWENKHLPAVGAGEYEENGAARLGLVGRSQGVLEELEKAHIYIEQLHTTLEERGEQMELLMARLAELEAAVEN